MLVSSLGFEPFDPGLMSLTNTVPAFVPLLFHNSRPCIPSSAVKYDVPLMLVKLVEADKLLPESELMSLTSFAVA